MPRQFQPAGHSNPPSVRGRLVDTAKSRNVEFNFQPDHLPKSPLGGVLHHLGNLINGTCHGCLVLFRQRERNGEA